MGAGLPGQPAAVPPQAGADGDIGVEHLRLFQEGLDHEKARERLAHQRRLAAGAQAALDEGLNLFADEATEAVGMPLRRIAGDQFGVFRRQGQFVATVDRGDADDDHIAGRADNGSQLGDARDVVKVLILSAVEDVEDRIGLVALGIAGRQPDVDLARLVHDGGGQGVGLADDNGRLDRHRGGCLGEGRRAARHRQAEAQDEGEAAHGAYSRALAASTTASAVMPNSR